MQHLAIAKVKFTIEIEGITIMEETDAENLQTEEPNLMELAKIVGEALQNNLPKQKQEEQNGE